jgi:DNA-binding SARP family transcriptional activator
MLETLMNELSVYLFGRFKIYQNEQVITEFSSFKVGELFCYLLLDRERPHNRENLAALLWNQSSTSQSKRYLRKALWQLQTGLAKLTKTSKQSIIDVDNEWIKLNGNASINLDVACFENAFLASRGISGYELDAQKAQDLSQAIQLYKGDLLEGWYQDWCLFERERLQRLYLLMLDKLMRYCEAHGKYEAGLEYGLRILGYDEARERTHRCLMRLFYLSGDRTEALRQYERCCKILLEELDIKPAIQTETLFEQIRNDQVPLPSTANASTPIESKPSNSSLIDLLQSLKELQKELSNSQRQVQRKIEAVETLLTSE